MLCGVCWLTGHILGCFHTFLSSRVFGDCSEEVSGPLIMPGKVRVQSTHSYTIYGRRVGYRLRSVHPFEGLFGTNVGFWSPPLRPPNASPRCRSVEAA